MSSGTIKLGHYFDACEREQQYLSSHHAGAVDLRATFWSPERSSAEPLEYGAHEDPDVDARLSRLTERALVRTTGDHVPSLFDPAVAWVRELCSDLPAWWGTFLRCLAVAALAFGVLYLLAAVAVHVEFWRRLCS